MDSKKCGAFSQAQSDLVSSQTMTEGAISSQPAMDKLTTKATIQIRLAN
jgi:hypothetical protein